MRQLNLSMLGAVALAVLSTSAQAAPCTTITINQDMVIHIQRGMTPEGVSGILGCMPTERPALGSSRLLVWGTEDINPRKQIAVDFAVNYAGSSALQARYQEIPLSPGVGMSGGNDTGVEDVATAAVLIAFAASRGSFIGSPAASGCTPATINPGAVSRIRPHTSIETVIAMIGCSPTEVFVAEEVGTTRYSFQVPLLDVELDVNTDSMGVMFAIYFDRTNPVGIKYNGALRIEPPLSPSWMPSAGVVPIR